MPRRGGLRAERGDDRGAGGAVLDRHSHPRRLPGFRENLSVYLVLFRVAFSDEMTWKREKKKRKNDD